MEHNETGCQVPLGAPKLCANGCGFFGTAATMNLCSKCHKDFIMKQEQTKLASSSLESIVNGSSSNIGNEPAVSIDLQTYSAETLVGSAPASSNSALGTNGDTVMKASQNRCTTCRKRVGLTGFSCRCGNLFCSIHRYSDKHGCTYDYRTAGQKAIAKANPIVKAKKLDNI